MSNKITIRVPQKHTINDVLGCRFSTNISPTMRAQLIGYDENLAYFKTLPNDEWPKYNYTAGQEFWILLKMVICEQPMEWSCELQNSISEK